MYYKNVILGPKDSPYQSSQTVSLFRSIQNLRRTSFDPTENLKLYVSFHSIQKLSLSVEYPSHSVWSRKIFSSRYILISLDPKSLLSSREWSCDPCKKARDPTRLICGLKWSAEIFILEQKLWVFTQAHLELICIIILLLFTGFKNQLW